MVPSLEFVRASHGIEDFLAGLEAKMVRVVQAEAASCPLELFWGETFERSLRGYRHKYREVNLAMGKGQDGCAGAGGGALPDQLKGEGR